MQCFHNEVPFKSIYVNLFLDPTFKYNVTSFTMNIVQRMDSLLKNKMPSVVDFP
jgi:hypothetical protein